ncbi:MAG TPA: hypothetical protein VG722_09770, partial [Tepidisphaeraceae bacterium]|nr:hypothetical protein [Tepidisphaeraceae bacterium]
LPWETMLCMLLAPPLIALNIYGSMYESLHVDFQPQGRYLFPSLIPIFFLFAGTWKIENKWFRWAHAMLFGVLLVVSYYSLLYYGALNETLRDTMNY